MIASFLTLAMAAAAPTPTSDLVDTAAQAGGFQTLLVAVEKAGLEGALRGKDALTVLAPSDEAFAALPEGLLETLLEPRNKGSLAALLTYHVAAGSRSASHKHTIHICHKNTCSLCYEV